MIIFVFTLVILLNLCAAILGGIFIRKMVGPGWLCSTLWGAMGLWAIAMILCFRAFIQTPWLFSRDFLRAWFYFPLSASLVWNLLLLLPFVGVTGLVLLLGWVKKRFPKKAPPEKGEDSTHRLFAAKLTKRQFLGLAALGTAPVVALSAGVHGTWTRYDLRVRKFAVPVADLPGELHGFTITHLSDLHSGLFCGPKRLRLIGDTANDLKSELVLVTGDVIDSDVADIPPVLAMLQRVESRNGLYLSQGNHDIIPGPDQLIEACQEARLPFLYQDHLRLRIRGCLVDLAGLPWFDPHKQDNQQSLAQLYPHDREKGEVRLLLAHHPDIFDTASRYADVVFSGHTHGGQLMWGDFGIGSLIFQYWSGLHRRDKSTLLVSNGCGDWFPCRLGAPAEILKVTLVPQVTP